MPRKLKRDYKGTTIEKDLYALDLKEFIRIGLKQFLGGKSAYDGKLIPDKELYSENSYRTIMRTPFDDETFNYIHNQCLSKVPKQNWYKENMVPWSVHYLLGLLSELKLLNIPKEFQPGFLLLYFKFCKGIDIPPPPLL